MTIPNRDWPVPDWVLLGVATVILLYILGTRNFKRFSKQNIPYVKPLPFVGTMGKALLTNQAFPDHVLEMYSKLQGHPYGGIFMFTYPILMLRDPEIIKTIAIKDFEYFTDHRSVVTDENNAIWSKGVFNLKGQRWKEVRSTLSPAFTSSKMKNMFVLISECCQQVVGYLEHCYTQLPTNSVNIKKDGNVLVLELKDFFTRYTNDVIATVAFGIGVDSLKDPKNEFYLMGQEATSLSIVKMFVILASSKLTKMLGISLISKNVTEFFRTLVRDTMETREREGIVRPDMLQLLMEAQKGTLHEENSGEANRSHKIKLDEDDVLAQAVSFFLAGFDTASTLLCFASHQLAVHPDIQTRLQEEIDQSLQENKGKFTYESIHSMKYLDMVVSETLRLYPPAALVDRICVRNYTLKSDPPVDLKAGDNLYIPIFGLHRDPNHYPDPERFDPERFSDDNKHNINPTTFLPFGIGPRICIGNRFALMETKLAMAYLLSKFTIKVVTETPLPIKIIQKGFNMSIKGGFWLGIEQRK